MEGPGEAGTAGTLTVPTLSGVMDLYREAVGASFIPDEKEGDLAGEKGGHRSRNGAWTVSGSTTPCRRR